MDKAKRFWYRKGVKRRNIVFVGNFFVGSNDRCAVDFETLKLAIDDTTALAVLEQLGYKQVHESITQLACTRIGRSQYKRNCQQSEAPDFVDCSSFVKWIYARKGIWLPRHPIDQRYSGQDITDCCKQVLLQEGDLLFSTGRRNLYWDTSSSGVGHVGIVSSNHTVIHAANSKVGIIEQPLDKILQTWPNRGVVRIITHPSRTYTLENNPHRIVECSSAFRWKILSFLARA